jgi:hypothetical protein
MPVAEVLGSGNGRVGVICKSGVCEEAVRALAGEIGDGVLCFTDCPAGGGVDVAGAVTGWQATAIIRRLTSAYTGRDGFVLFFMTNWIPWLS